MATALEENDAIREVLAEYCFRLDGGQWPRGLAPSLHRASPEHRRIAHVLNPETPRPRLTVIESHHTRPVPQCDARARNGTQQRIEHRLGVVGHREVLAGLFQLQLHAERREPPQRLLDVKRPQHPRHERS